MSVISRLSLRSSRQASFAPCAVRDSYDSMNIGKASLNETITVQIFTMVSALLGDGKRIVHNDGVVVPMLWGPVEVVGLVEQALIVSAGVVDPVLTAPGPVRGAVAVGHPAERPLCAEYLSVG